MSEHTIQKFDEDMDKLRSRLIMMGSLVQQQVEYIMQVITSSNTELARLIIQNDDKIDKLDVKIDKQCLKIFALHQPFAADLRLVMSAISINDTMELIGDLAVNIAKDIIEINANFEPINGKTKLQDMGHHIELILTRVIDAFIFADVSLARQAIGIKQDVKQYFHENFILISDLIKSNPDLALKWAYMLDINRNLKFMADLAISIAQEVIFLVEAKIIKHNYQQRSVEAKPEE